ncbi:MAG: peptide chain release factor N(5)-glutamine methyltransferase [Treponema sp.]|jgi:release factor glutamine methyltransferase|nr:peptide chain release factor N(5)-glutamine methyltransferase [Treponema sp.]
MTVRELFGAGTRWLRISGAAHIEAPERDSRLLLGTVLGLDRAGLISKVNDLVSDMDQGRYEELLDRRLQGECIAYIVGYKEFYGLDFTVTRDVLVPRPDTETLVEAGLSYIDGLASPEACVLLDICTGSGAVGIALKHERPGIAAVLADISPAALRSAQENLRHLLPGSDLPVIESDLFDRLEGQFTLITANPPYIPSNLIDTLALEVQKEPRLSLDGGTDGLEIIRRLVVDAKSRLTSGGLLLIEGDPSQMDSITELLRKNDYKAIRTYLDLSGCQRVIGGSV